MKKIFFLVLISFASTSLLAQTQKEEKINVSGNCGTCKKKIEKAATAAGATYASWDKTTKVLEVKYDTQDVKASDEAYKKLDECCQYDRKNPKKQ